MAFLLSREDKPDGTAHFTIDIGVTERVNMVVPLANAHITEMIPPNDLLNYTLSSIRPPISQQKGNR